MEHKEKEIRSELESTKKNYAKSAAFVGQQEAEFKAKVSELESANEAAVKELRETKALLAESEGTNEDLESKRAKINELEEFNASLSTQNNEFYEKNASLSTRIKAGEVMSAELDTLKKEKDEALEKAKSSEEALKAKIEALEQECSALREQTFQDPPSGSSSISSPQSSPIKPFDDEALANSTFGDDTFDESMFLPNVNEQVNDKTPDQGNGNSTPQTDENSKTPSKTPFKEKRALFSPDEQPSKKKRASKKAASKTQTPVRRTTRSSMRLRQSTSSRTPLGKSAMENTPLSSRKVRTNWNGKVSEF